MPSARKNRRKRINYDINKKNQWRSFKKKKNPHIECTQIREAWDKSKSVKENLKDMGIAYDPNDKSIMKKSIKVKPTLIEDIKPEKKPRKEGVIADMEAEAAFGEKDKEFKLSTEEVLLCTYMMDKYNECYKAMARDRRNHYQLTPKQFRNKIRAFKRSKKQYQEYINSKNKTSEESNTVVNDVEME